MVCVYGPRCDGKTYETVIYGYTGGLGGEGARMRKHCSYYRSIGWKTEGNQTQNFH